MSAIPVADTIAEIMERMSSLSLRGFGHKITENIKHLLTAIKEKCSGSEKLDLSDPSTQEWVRQVTKLFYLVDDLSDDGVMLSRQRRTMMPLFSLSVCSLKPLLQLKQIEKLLLRKLAPMKNVKMLPNRDAKEEEEEETVVRRYVQTKIIDCVLEKEQGVNIRAVVIRGFTGLEKGRIAKYVCEDEKVKSRFDVVVPIDALDLENHYADSVVNRVNLQKGSGAGKDFMVILDDFHNENSEEWLELLKKLKEVAEASGGSGVLFVTTRSKFVHQMDQDHTFHKLRFDRLSPDESRSLFEEIACGIGTETRDIDVDALLEMCGGILGAIETMALLVRSRNSDINELKDEFVQKMLSRYYSELDLRSWRLRQCFAYSFFLLSTPYYDSVRREELVKLWMAEGFLGNSCSSPEPEDLGHEVIEEFLRRSIFKVDEDGEIISVLAATFELGNNNVDVGRVSLSLEFDVSKGCPRSLLKPNKKMITFVLKKQSSFPNRVMLSWSACDEILSMFTELRVLTLKDLGLKVLPASIGDLKSLRYLNLSRNSFKKLPACIGELNHLQTLQLSHCLELKELPDAVNYFASLRHLEVDKCPNLMHMPFALKKLTRIRSLPHFVTSKRNGLGELVHLNEVRGELEISHLERFKFKGSPRAPAYLKEKQHLEGLTLRWNHDDDDDQDDEIVLKQLEPHQNLKRLSIIGYQGNQFPGWFSALKFNNLAEISLRKCSKCRSLSTLDHILANLEKLTLMSLDSLEFITDNGNKDLRLKQVQILDCPKLTSWWKNPQTHNTIAFTAISELVVESCPKLVTLPLFPTLDYRLVLEYANMQLLLNTLRYAPTGSDPSLSKLNHLTMMNMDEKQYPKPEEKVLKNLTSLSSLDIKNCKELKVIRGWKHLNSLEILNMTKCTGIDLPSDEWEGLKNLNQLIIEDVPDLKSLPEGIKHLTNLENLEIISCPNLETVPENVGEGLSPFTFIVFDDCPKLASLPESLTSKFIGLKVGNCPLLESLNHSRPEILEQAPDIQEEDQNLTAQISNTDNQEIQNTDNPIAESHRCNHCGVISNTDNEEIQNKDNPNKDNPKTESRRCNHCGSWIIR